MFATEITDESIACASENVNQNHLNESIELIKADADDEPFDALNRNEKFTVAAFSMCNPPFFNDEIYTSSGEPLEMDHNNRTGKRKAANNVRSGSGAELITSGGEIEFVKRMIHNSRSFGDRIKVFTTMLGHKSSLAPIQSELNAQRICNYCTTEFCQGRTMRWAIAWTFHRVLLLRIVPKCGQNTAKKLLRHPIEANTGIEVISEKLITILSKLECSIVDRQQRQANRHEFHFVAERNSWSKQRQKKRAAAMMREKQNESLNSEDAVPAEKRQKVDGIDFVERTNDDGQRENAPHLHVVVGVDRDAVEGNEITLEYLNGIGGVDSAYQLLQFIKNKWKE